MKSEFHYSKKGQRHLSAFIGEELLYEYITEKLDDSRKSAVENFLSDTQQSQHIADKIKNGISYTEKLSGTTISEALIDEIRNPKTLFHTLIRRFKVDKWPIGIRLALQALIVSITLAAIGILIPWDRVLKFGPIHRSSPETIAEVEKQKFSTTDDFAQQNIQPIDAVYPDEDLNDKKIETHQADNDTPTENPAPTAKTQSNPTGAPAVVVTKGFLYRGVLKVDDVSGATEELKNKIAQLGGVKAGQVDIGWKKDKSSTYFHFTLPLGKYDEVMKAFADQGKLSIKKEIHPRKMPDGVIRFIVIVVQ